MEYLLYLIASKTSLKDAINILQQVEQGDSSEFIKIMLTYEFQKKQEIFDQKDIVHFFNKHLTDEQLFELMTVNDVLIEQVYPKLSHNLWKRIKRFIPLPISKLWLYNLDEGPYEDWDQCDEMYEYPSTLNLSILFQIAQHGYVPHLLSFAKEQRPEEFLEIMRLADNQFDRILWWRKHRGAPNIKRLFSFKKDKLLAELFIIPSECMSLSMSSPTQTNACQECKLTEIDWNEFNLDWRCIANCDENPFAKEQQCMRFCISLDERAMNLWREKTSVLPPSFHLGSRFTILSEQPAPFHIRHRYREKHWYQRNQQDLDDEEITTIGNIVSVWTYAHGETYITWIQVSEISLQIRQGDFRIVKEVSLFSLVNWDCDVFYNSYDQRAYIDSKYTTIPFTIELTWNRLEKKEQWFYTLDQISTYFHVDPVNVANALWEDKNFNQDAVHSLLNVFGSNPTEILETMIQSNIRIHTLRLNSVVPVLLLSPPQEEPNMRKTLYVWKDMNMIWQRNSMQLWFERQHVKSTPLIEGWRKQHPRNPFHRIHKLFFLKDVKEPSLVVFGQIYNINKLVKDEDTSIPRDRITELPQHCADLFLMEDKANINDFLEQKDESAPLVFLRKRKDKFFAVCMRKEQIQQFKLIDESFYFGCMKEGTQYIDPTRTYMKLNLFQGAPSFLTLENIETILSLDYTYWLEQENPFVQLPFVGKTTFLTREEMTTEQDLTSALHCQHGTEQKVHLFFPVEINLEPPQPKRHMKSVTVHT